MGRCHSDTSDLLPYLWSYRHQHTEEPTAKEQIMILNDSVLLPELLSVVQLCDRKGERHFVGLAAGTHRYDKLIVRLGTGVDVQELTVWPLHATKDHKNRPYMSC